MRIFFAIFLINHFAVDVAGKGNFRAGIICYPADARGVRTKDKNKSSLTKFTLTGEPQVLEGAAEQKTFGYCCPYINVEGDGSAEISEFSLTPVAAAPVPKKTAKKKPGKQ